MKIQQMSFMLIAVTLLVIIAGLFFISIMTADIQTEALDLQEREALELVTRIADLPEFKCQGQKAYCIDAEKALMLRNKEEYKELWQIEGIIIKRLYPTKADDEGVECTITNFPDCSIIKINTNNEQEPYWTYVSLCRKANSDKFGVYDKCELAQVMVEIDEKRFEK